MQSQALFPFLLEEILKVDFLSHASVLNIPKGTEILRPEAYVKGIPFVKSGLVKVLRADDDGNEILLYYISAGESCAMSLKAAIENSKSGIFAVAEQDTETYFLPVEYLRSLMAEHHAFREYVFLALSQRYNELLTAIDNIAFRKLDERLIAMLRQKFSHAGMNEITTSHQQLADELNSSREVISRLLKQLEKRGYLRLERNKMVMILDL
jgi:CRP/FNR family transcriptional regulator